MAWPSTRRRGTLYGFVINDTDNATLIPVDPNTSTIANTRSQLVIVNTATGAVTPVNLANWNDGLAIYGAAFDPAGNLWAVDLLTDQVLRIDPATGLVVAGTAVPVGADVTVTVDLAFTANGVGVIVTGDFTFYMFDPVQSTVTPLTAAPATPVGFDSGLVPPFGVAGVAFTTHLAARNLNPDAAQICRLNLYEGRQQDQYGHANDPFHSNPIIAYADLNAGSFIAAPAIWPRTSFPIVCLILAMRPPATMPVHRRGMACRPTSNWVPLSMPKTLRNPPPTPTATIPTALMTRMPSAKCRD